MKTLRIAAALLLALTAAAACTGSPTGPTLHAGGAAAQMEGTGYMGGGTR